MTPAPVVLFVYNRSQQVVRVLESLKRNNVPRLYVFSDGPRTSGDAQRVDEVRKVLRSIDWVQTDITERAANHGVRESMILGLEKVFGREDRAIVVEDDVNVAPEFCRFMSACLERYKDERKVAGVTGLRYPFSTSALEGYPYDAFISPRFCSWGWGTWKRWWETIDFNHDRMAEWVSRSSDDVFRVAGPDVPQMAHYLLDLGPKWGATTADVYSLLHMVRNGEYFVCPTWNMVENLGLSEGTHAAAGGQSWSLAWEEQRASSQSFRLPVSIEIAGPVWPAMDAFLDSIRVPESRTVQRRSARGMVRQVVEELSPPILFRVARKVVHSLRVRKPRS